MARKNIPQIDALVQRTFAQKMWDNGFHPYKDHTEWLRHHPRGRVGRLYAVFPPFYCLMAATALLFIPDLIRLPSERRRYRWK